MSFGDFLKDEGLKVGPQGIPQMLVDAFDSVGPLIKMSYGIPSLGPPIPNPAIILKGVAFITSKTKGDPVGPTLLFTLLMTDIIMLIYPILLAASISLKLPVPVGQPGIPLASAKFIPSVPPLPGPPSKPGTQKFGKAFLKWAISFIDPADLRLIKPFTVP